MRGGINNAQLLLAGLASVTGVSAVYRGVNLGSWLVTEPWMVPTLYNSTGADSEWALCAALGKSECLKTLQQHWSSFITRDDFVQIQKAGLRAWLTDAVCERNAVRIPLGYWSVDILDYEPYVGGQYPYLIQGVQWAGELGLKVFIDLHGAPGSQNGWEETGIVNPPAFFANQTNIDRTLKVLKNLTSEFSQSHYNGVVTNIEPLNEPTYGYAELAKFYSSAGDIIGAANSSGINMTISDAFFNPHTWRNFDPWNPSAQKPAPHITLDTHQFWAFPPLDKLDKAGVLDAICAFATSELRVAANLGTPPTLVGEWSLSTGITANSTTDAGQDRAKRTWFRELFEAQAVAYAPSAADQPSIGWFFWSWKTDYNIDAWSLQKGIQQGYVPSNISDLSTYEYPIASNGCIDQSHNYTAPDLPSDSTSSSSSSSSPATSSTTPATSSAANVNAATTPTNTKTGDATVHRAQSWMALALVVLFGMTL